MAKQPQENQLTSAFLEEVEEDLRQEKIKKMWRRYGPPAAVVAVLIVMGVFGWSFYVNSKEGKAQAVSDEFLNAISQISAGQGAPATQILTELSQSGVRGYEFSSLMALAYQAAEQKDIPAALEYYDLILKGGFDKPYKDLALILAAQTAIGTPSYNNYQTEIEKLSASNSSLKWIAREIKALQFISLGENASAKTELEALAENQDTPNDIRARATTILDFIE